MAFRSSGRSPGRKRPGEGVGLDSGSSCGRVGSYFFHSASLRKKNTGLSAPLGKARASPGPPWPVLSRVLRRRRPIIVDYPTQPLPRPVLGLRPAGAGRGRLYITKHYANLPLRQPPPRRAHARPTVPSFCGAINVLWCAVSPPGHPFPLSHTLFLQFFQRC